LVCGACTALNGNAALAAPSGLFSASFRMVGGSSSRKRLPWESFFFCFPRPRKSRPLSPPMNGVKRRVSGVTKGVSPLPHVLFPAFGYGWREGWRSGSKGVRFFFFPFPCPGIFQLLDCLSNFSRLVNLFYPFVPSWFFCVLSLTQLFSPVPYTPFPFPLFIPPAKGVAAFFYWKFLMSS